MSAASRRQGILEALSVRRQESVDNLASEFNVSRRTIRYDIEQLTCFAPIYTVKGNGGGVYVAEGWYYSRVYLQDKQEALLKRLLFELPPEDQDTIQSILDTFAKPKPKCAGSQ